MDRKFPEMLFVTLEEVDGEDMTLSHKSVDDIADDLDGDYVGVYELVRLSVLRITKELKGESDDQ